MEKQDLLTPGVKASLERQHYKTVGSHSAVKVCTWTKKSLRGEGFCYKQKFYGIRSHLCCQMTPTLLCTNACVFCWRDMAMPTGDAWRWKTEPAPDIIDGCIRAQIELLSGFGGNEKTGPEKFEEAKEPMHFAISLSGEPTLYPGLDGLIKELHKRGKTTFVVTNGMLPERVSGIEPPTQLYLSLDAPNETLFRRIDKPMHSDGWQRLMDSLDALKGLKEKTRTTVRLTLIKGLNMESPEAWAGLIRIAEPMFAEVKAYMFVGYSRKRLKMENMPLHSEVKGFAARIAKASGYRIIDEKPESRVVLLMKEDRPDRVMRFQDSGRA